MGESFRFTLQSTSAVERVLAEKKRTAMATAICDVMPEPDTAARRQLSKVRKSGVEQDREDRRQRRLDRYNEVVGWHLQGMSQQSISLTLHSQRRTIRCFLRADQNPERATALETPGINKFQAFLVRR